MLLSFWSLTLIVEVSHGQLANIFNSSGTNCKDTVYGWARMTNEFIPSCGWKLILNSSIPVRDVSTTSGFFTADQRDNYTYILSSTDQFQDLTFKLPNTPDLQIVVDLTNGSPKISVYWYCVCNRTTNSTCQDVSNSGPIQLVNVNISDVSTNADYSVNYTWIESSLKMLSWPMVSTSDQPTTTLSKAPQLTATPMTEVTITQHSTAPSEATLNSTTSADATTSSAVASGSNNASTTLYVIVSTSLVSSMPSALISVFQATPAAASKATPSTSQTLKTTTPLLIQATTPSVKNLALHYPGSTTSTLQQNDTREALLTRSSTLCESNDFSTVAQHKRGLLICAIACLDYSNCTGIYFWHSTLRCDIVFSSCSPSSFGPNGADTSLSAASESINSGSKCSAGSSRRSVSMSGCVHYDLLRV